MREPNPLWLVAVEAAAKSKFGPSEISDGGLCPKLGIVYRYTGDDKYCTQLLVDGKG